MEEESELSFHTYYSAKHRLPDHYNYAIPGRRTRKNREFDMQSSRIRRTYPNEEEEVLEDSPKKFDKKQKRKQKIDIDQVEMLEEDAEAVLVPKKIKEPKTKKLHKKRNRLRCGVCLNLVCEEAELDSHFKGQFVSIDVVNCSINYNKEVPPTETNMIDDTSKYHPILCLNCKTMVGVRETPEEELKRLESFVEDIGQMTDQFRQMKLEAPAIKTKKGSAYEEKDLQQACEELRDLFPSRKEKERKAHEKRERDSKSTLIQNRLTDMFKSLGLKLFSNELGLKDKPGKYATGNKQVDELVEQFQPNFIFHFFGVVPDQ